MRRIIRTLLSSIVATVVCTGAAGAQPAFRQAEAIEPFFQALMRGDIDAAYAQTHAHFRKVTDKPKFAAFVKRDRLDEVKHYFAVDLRSHSLREDNWSADVSRHGSQPRKAAV